MEIVILDGSTVIQDDLSWSGLKELGTLTYFERTETEDIIKRIGKSEIVITSKCMIDKNVMDKSPNLKYIGVIATGYNNVDIRYAQSKGITVTNIPAYSTDSVAQFTFSLLLEVANKVGIHNDSVHKGDWSDSPDFCYALSPQVELAGKTMGIVGYGNIGKKVAHIARAFGMRVLFFSEHKSVTDESSYSVTKENKHESNIEFVGFHTLIKESDIISLHCALTENNKEIINKDVLEAMKDTAILINTSRGPLINEHDLDLGLRARSIKAAALDVVSKEPLQKDNPLLNNPYCIITPHIAWITKEARQRLIDIATGNVKAFLNENPINKIV